MNAKLLTDEQLLKRARRDPEAFGAFYDRHEAPLLAYLVRMTGSPELAGDLAAEVFACLLRTVSEGKRVRHARGWLYAVARNQIASAARRETVDARARAAMRMEPLTLSDESLDAITELSSDSSPSAMSALAALPPDERRAIELRVLDGAAYEEVALRLECSEAAVRQRVSRGLARLRTRLEGQNP